MSRVTRKLSQDALFVTSTLGVGGSETKVVHIANSLARSGYSIELAYLNPPDTLLNKLDGSVPVSHLHRRGKYSLTSARKLRRLMAKGFGTVILVNLYPLLYAVPAARFLTRTDTRLVCLINTTDFLSDSRDWGRIYAPFLRRCDDLIFGCAAQQDIWTTRYNLPTGRSTYIYNGVDCEHFSPKADFDSADSFRLRYKIPADAIVVGSVGRCDPEKNYGLLVEAAKILHSSGREIYLLLVGDGAEKPKIADAMARAGIGDRFVGPGILEDVRPALSAMDIFVLPSRAVETFSNAALEALAMTLPVVMSEVGGAAEMVEHNQSGFLFESENVEMLVAALVSLYDSKTRRIQMGLAARQRALKQFDFQSMLLKYRNLIDIGNRDGAAP